MNLNRNHFIEPPQREALISLTAIYFIQEHALLSREQLEDARQSLQALFLRTSGEETMLRKLIEILKTNRNIHHSFASIAGILEGVSKCVATLEGKIAGVRHQLEMGALTPQEQAEFAGPFLTFSHEFVTSTRAFSRALQEYLGAKEDEARATGMYRIAEDARARIRERLSGTLGSAKSGEPENKIRQEIVASFDFGETEANHRHAMHTARSRENELRDALREIKMKCQLAMNPSMRDHTTVVKPEDDVFKRFAEALAKHPRLQEIKPSVIELFKLYQHTYGIFRLDFDRLNRAIDTMMENTDAYFVAKEEDQDIMVKRDKLRKIEALIPFLEHAAKLAWDEEADTYFKFSRLLSTAISAKKAAWSIITEDLLRCKVQAEAEVSTQL